MQSKRMYRNTGRHVIGGVCSGLGEYLGIDPVIIRILFVLLALVGGGGVLIYLILWIVIPEIPMGQYYQNPNPPHDGTQGASHETGSDEPFEKAEYQYSNESDNQNSEVDNVPGRGSLIGGVILIGLGLLFLVDEYIPRLYLEDFWPLLLVIVGVVLLYSYYNKNKE